MTPILNVSDMAASFAWFEKWGWKKLWDWGTPPTFGAVGSGKETCIFLCDGAQGGRGRGPNTTTFQVDGDEAGDKGVWMSVWVDDVDAMHKHCVTAGLEITFPPTNMPWNVREMHLRHPDGHVFRGGRGIEEKHSVRSKIKAHVKKITKRREVRVKRKEIRAGVPSNSGLV